MTETIERAVHVEPLETGQLIARGLKYLGKIGYTDRGAKACPCYLEYELKMGKHGPVFTMSGHAWNHIRSDILIGGQCCEELVRRTRTASNPQIKRMLQVWRMYHMNDCHAGTERQEKWIEMRRVAAIKIGENVSHSYTVQRSYLERIGLLFDTLPDGTLYEYGTGWLYRAIPDDVIAEIKTWGSDDQ